MIRIKRVYDKREPRDGYRVLVDRLWPRGVSKEKAGVDEWARELAPSDALRRSFRHAAAKWPDFQAKFRVELRASAARAALKRLSAVALRRTVTLVYAARDQERNNARVVRDLLVG